MPVDGTNLESTTTSKRVAEPSSVISSRRTLSKSDFKLARTCAAKLYFRENGYPDNRDSNPYLALLADGGYMVEALAKLRHPDGVLLEYGKGVNVAESYVQTVEYLKRDTVTLFEATLLHNRRQARVDILEKKGNVVRLLEVKARSFDSAAHLASLAEGAMGVLRGKKKPYKILSDWAEKLEDITFQTIILEKLRPDLVVKPYLVLVDKSKRASVDNVPNFFELVVDKAADGGTHVQTARYSGPPDLLAELDLVTEIDVSEEVAMLRDEVEQAAAQFETLLDAPLSAFEADITRSSKCRDCEFRVPEEITPNGFIDCWGPLAMTRPHVLELYSVGRAKLPDDTPLVEAMFAAGSTSLHDVPLDCFETKPDKPGAIGNRQLRQIRHTRDNSIYCPAELRREVTMLERRARAGEKLFFIDFETSRLALPYHKGMSPYGLVAFQWSCHTLDAFDTVPRHSEFLNTVDIWPNQSFAQTLRDAIGDAGPVLTWSHFEGTTLKQIAGELSRFGHDAPELVEWMHDVVEHRIVDLHEWARCWYYNPGMRGRTSIKVVLDALWQSDPTMRAEFAQWTGRPSEGVDDPYRTLPKIEIAGVLQDVHEGTGAMRAYQEMMYGAEKNVPATKDKWAALLKQYCALDTLSMVLVLEHWRRLTAR